MNGRMIDGTLFNLPMTAGLLERIVNSGEEAIQMRCSAKGR